MRGLYLQFSECRPVVVDSVFDILNFIGSVRRDYILYHILETYDALPSQKERLFALKQKDEGSFQPHEY